MEKDSVADSALIAKSFPFLADGEHKYGYARFGPPHLERHPSAPGCFLDDRDGKLLF
jgi:hypothetical protein